MSASATLRRRSRIDGCSAIAVVVAAGSSVRMAGVDKLFAPLAGVPVLAHTLRALQAAPLGAIVLVTSEMARASCEDLVHTYCLQRVRAICLGGCTRQESVYRGLQVAAGLESGLEWAVVHDGARPLVTAELVAACLAAAREHGAAVAATPVTDTIKLVDADGLVCRTLPRSELWAAQTPQVGRLHDLVRVHTQAWAAGLQATDDAALLEWKGIPVKVVPAPAENIKITTLHDLEVARTLLQRRMQEQRT